MIHLIQQPVSFLCSCQPQQLQDCCWKGVCMVAAWNNAVHFEGSYYCADWRVAVWRTCLYHLCVDILAQQINHFTGRQELQHFLWAYSCHIFVIFLEYFSQSLVIFLSLFCHIAVIFWSYVGHIPVIIQLYSCPNSVILLFLSYFCHISENIVVILLSVNDTVIFCVCLSGRWRRSISGRYVAKAAGLCCIWEQPRKQWGIPLAVCLPQEHAMLNSEDCIFAWQ